MPQPRMGKYLSWSLSTILTLPAAFSWRAACQMYHQSASTWWFAIMIAGFEGSAGSSPVTESFVNGKLVSGAQPFAVFAAVIEEELRERGKAGGGDGAAP